MKNKYIPKKIKMTIIINAMYQRNSTFVSYARSETLERIGRVLMPNVDVTKFSQLCKWYHEIELNIIRLHGDYMVRLSYIVAYANQHNIKLYPREFFRF